MLVDIWDMLAPGWSDPPDTMRFSAPAVGEARIKQLDDTWREAVMAVARTRYEAFAKKIGWPAWDDMEEDELGEASEIKAMHCHEVEQDLLEHARKVHEMQDDPNERY